MLNVFIVANTLSPHSNFINIWNAGTALTTEIYSILDIHRSDDDRYTAATMMAIGKPDVIYSGVDQWDRKVIVIGIDDQRSIIIYERYSQGDEGFITADFPKECTSQVFVPQVMYTDERLSNKDLMNILSYLHTKPITFDVDCSTCTTTECPKAGISEPVKEKSSGPLIWQPEIWAKYYSAGPRWNVLSEAGHHNDLFDVLDSMPIYTNVYLEREYDKIIFTNDQVLPLKISYKQREQLQRRFRGNYAEGTVLMAPLYQTADIRIVLMASSVGKGLPMEFQLCIK